MIQNLVQVYGTIDQNQEKITKCINLFELILARSNSRYTTQNQGIIRYYIEKLVQIHSRNHDLLMLISDDSPSQIELAGAIFEYKKNLQDWREIDRFVNRFQQLENDSFPAQNFVLEILSPTSQS